MNFATQLARNSGRATPSLRCTPIAHHNKEENPAEIHLSQKRSCSDNRSQLRVRNALYDVAVKAANGVGLQDATCIGVIFRFKAIFSKDEAQTFINTLSEVIFGRNDDIQIVSIRTGSTWVECVFPYLTSAASVMGAVNLLLSQSNTTVDKVTQLSSKIKKALVGKKPAKKTTPKKPRKTKEPSRIPAIMNPAIEIPQLAAIRAAVLRSGEILVRFDDEVEVLLVISKQGRQLRR